MGKSRKPSSAFRQPVRDKPAEPALLRKPRSPYQWWISLFLLISTLAVYWQVRSFEFVDYDDPDYSQNPHVRPGFTADGLVWAFTSGEASNWLPLTRISHMADWQAFGNKSGSHHLMNVFYHALATLFLFAFLYQATGSCWPSAWVAFLFALHPVHVESVAWASERKDVLSALFWFLALWSYVRYTEHPEWRRYLLVIAIFCCGLMAKPMVVTLPVVLLLLDFWPLDRLPWHNAVPPGINTRPRLASWKKALWEKAPFLVLSIGASLAAILTQRSAGSLDMLHVPLTTRMENALTSYLAYIVTMFWPTHLAVLYPYPRYLPLALVMTAGLAIAGISGFALRTIRSHPYVAVGWSWYVATLLPVIGLLQVGIQARADRYTYIPLVGVSLMIAWGVQSLFTRWPRCKPAVIPPLLLANLVLVFVTWNQIHYWKNSETLYRRALAVTDQNYTMHYGLAVVLSRTPGRLEDAISEYRAALQIRPDYVQARGNLGAALLFRPGGIPQAIAEYRAGLRLNPNSAELHNNLGAALMKMPGNLPAAIEQFEMALKLRRNFAEARLSAIAAHQQRAALLSGLPGRQADAVMEYQEALRLNPDSAELHSDLARLLAQIPGRLAEALAEYEAAVRASPNSAETHTNLATVLAAIPGRAPEAVDQYRIAVALKPELMEARYDFGILLAQMGQIQPAVEQLQAALKLSPDPRIREALRKIQGDGDPERGRGKSTGSH
jgi:protein O-mannosyl-transferase